MWVGNGMAAPEIAQEEPDVIQAPAQPVHVHGGAADRAPAELGVKLGVASAVASRHPHVTLGQRQADGIPVDQEQLARPAHDVARMRLSVGDHGRPTAGGLAHQLIEARQRRAQARCLPGQQPARGLTVGTAAPRLVQLAERRLQGRPAGRAEAAGRRGPPGQRGGAVQPGQDADEHVPVGLGQLAAEVHGRAVEIWEHGDGVLLAERGERLPPGGGHRRDGELQPRPAQGDDGLHRRPQVRVSGLRAGAAPATGQARDGDEPAAARGVGELPVVVAEADREVAQPGGGQAPLLVQDPRQLRPIDIAGFDLHGLNVKIAGWAMTRLPRRRPGRPR
jgi:hypothetical protein